MTDFWYCYQISKGKDISQLKNSFVKLKKNIGEDHNEVNLIILQKYHNERHRGFQLGADYVGENITLFFI